MQIFQAEIDDGLDAKIAASASISYACALEPCSTNIQRSMKHDVKSLASLDDSDLYYVQSILVSSSWNKNDDIFDAKEVWLARNTPEDKPTNLEHDESTIIGHITANWPITIDGSLIDEDTSVDDLPEKYHILTGSVIYKGFSNPALRQRSDKLISEIENGTKYVSMECFFKSFDYGIMNKSTGEYKVLTRNDSTAYLTKYLKAYGGLGEHENYKIGRVLRNIVFSGKGFVDKPANPDSIIFTKDLIHSEAKENLDEKNRDLLNLGVSNNQLTQKVENNIMNSESTQAEEVVEVAEVSTMPEAVESAEPAAVAQEEVTTQENTVDVNEVALAEVKTALEAMRLEKEDMAKKLVEKDEAMTKMQDDLNMALESLGLYKAKEAEMLKKEKLMKRVSALVEAGVDSNTANSTVDKFESMDDESFSALTALLAVKTNKVPEMEAPVTENTEEVVKSTETVDASVLDTAEVEEEVNLGVGGVTESAVEATRAALVEFVCSRLGKTL